MLNNNCNSTYFYTLILERRDTVVWKCISADSIPAHVKILLFFLPLQCEYDVIGPNLVTFILTVHILHWVSTSPFFLGGVSRLWDTTQSSLWLWPPAFSETTWTHLLAANYMALLSLQFLWLYFESTTVFTLGNPRVCDSRVWPLLKAPVARLTIEVYGAIQVLPGFFLLNSTVEFWSQYCCVVSRLCVSVSLYSSSFGHEYCFFTAVCPSHIQTGCFSRRSLC